MDMNVKTLKRNAGIIYGVILLLGVALSGFVFYSSQNVETNTMLLVEREIPILGQLQQLDSFFTEQELYLNEYYANQNRDLYSFAFLETTQQTNQLLTLIKEHNIASDKVEQLHIAQKKIQDLAVVFDQNMEFGDNNSAEKWDLAREHLAIFTQLRQETKPIVKEIVSDTNLRVQQQYELTQSTLQQTSQTVFFYSLLILGITIVIGRHIKMYLLVSAKNKRLALFPQRNPNPILSLDNKNQVAFANPATYRLINELSLNLTSFSKTVLNHVLNHQELVKSKDERHTRFEINISGRTLDCELHWLEDLHTWDLHLIDITQKKLAEEQLNYQAFHNAQSGLYNKNKFLQMLDELTLSSNHIAVGAIEIRHYSQMVSHIGWQQTEMVVTEVAKLLDEELSLALNKQNYTFFQTSEKQFSIIIAADYCSLQIQGLVDKIERIIEDKTFCNGMHIELDFGFCCYPDHANTEEALLRSVNIALDHAVSIDHSSLVIYSTDLGDIISKEIQLTEKLRLAIENHELQLYYQPQLDIQQDKIIGLETLIRWPTENGFVSPADFIPLAEKSGLIIQLGEWIVRSACQQAKKLVDMGYHELVIAINISPQQFRHPSFYSLIETILRQTQVPHRNIELEITEGVIMHNENDTIDLLHKLKKLGLMLSIDDFGTGYSSLSYLKQFPIDKLKIDQSFIRQINESEADRAIVNTVVELGKNLNLTLIAEGVEEQEQLLILSDMGCQEIQGYYFSKPLPIEQLYPLLSDHFRDSQLA